MQGPAVWALRAQTDKVEYSHQMRRLLEQTPNLHIREGEWRGWALGVWVGCVCVGGGCRLVKRGLWQLAGGDAAFCFEAKCHHATTPASSVLHSSPAGMVVSVEVGPNDEVTGVTTYFGITFPCRAAVLTTGTFMNGQIWVGRKSMAAGRAGACVLLFIG